MKNNPIYEITAAYPEMHSYYGLLCGLFYTVPLSVAGLYAGSLTKTSNNRKLMLVLTIGLLSMFQVSTGYFDSFLLLAILRFCHGTISSAINPLCYSLLADTFPAD